MKRFEDYNPIAVFFYFVFVCLTAMFCMNPVILALSFFGATVLMFSCGQVMRLRETAYYLIFLAAVILINPLLNHNGASVLFVLNNNPVTLEAAIYGVAAGSMLLSVFLWMRTFSSIMTSDKLLYVFGSFLPKVTLILSMTLRYIPLFKKQHRKTAQAQKALGLAKDDNIVDSVRSSMRVFSVMITWGLENGIITADSMRARGYGTGRRTHFALYRFRMQDALLLCVSALLAGITFVGIVSGELAFDYYPYFEVAHLSGTGAVSYAAYLLLTLLPSIIEAEERIKWKSLQSKI